MQFIVLPKSQKKIILQDEKLLEKDDHNKNKTKLKQTTKSHIKIIRLLVFDIFGFSYED